MATGTLAVRQEIGSYGITDSQFIEQLDKLGPVDHIQVFVNSVGGNVFQALGMMAALARHPARKTMTIEGLAASAASYFVMGGDTIEIVQGGFLMVHGASSGVIGTAADMRQEANVLDSITASVAGIYATRTGGSKADWLALMQTETWLTAEEVGALGIARVLPLTPVAPTTNTVKAHTSINNRSIRTETIISNMRRNRLSGGTDFEMCPKARERAARIAQIESDIARESRPAQRAAILARANSPTQATRYLEMN